MVMVNDDWTWQKGHPRLGGIVLRHYESFGPSNEDAQVILGTNEQRESSSTWPIQVYLENGC